jgi:Zn ribbon nucleic-acid-binding protein
MCPNCQAVWGMEEIEEQSCFACGYPDPDEDDIEIDDSYDYYDYKNETDSDL